ncbi:MAG: hypothetical protein AAF479_17970 [Pseudomonadota bacterium]
MTEHAFLSVDLREARRRFERQYFLALAARVGFRIEALAAASGMSSPAAVRRKLKSLGLWDDAAGSDLRDPGGLYG